ncbi:uncharacterized protein [Physcomitrium patens]|uniref:uncharacterized protein isoform X3 n=1 Tax=Physcomitrium patens TaxID=3218 RepID=UPI003CCD74C5
MQASLLCRAYLMQRGTNGALSWLAASSSLVPGPLLMERRVGIRSLCTLFPFVHYGVAALCAVFGNQPGRPWGLEELALIRI